MTELIQTNSMSIIFMYIYYVMFLFQGTIMCICHKTLSPINEQSHAGSKISKPVFDITYCILDAIDYIFELHPRYVRALKGHFYCIRTRLIFSGKFN